MSQENVKFELLDWDNYQVTIERLDLTLVKIHLLQTKFEDKDKLDPDYIVKLELLLEQATELENQIEEMESNFSNFFRLMKLSPKFSIKAHHELKNI